MACETAGGDDKAVAGESGGAAVLEALKGGDRGGLCWYAGLADAGRVGIGGPGGGGEDRG